MKIEQEFVVARSPDVVWDLFQDVPSVAQCLPGAELLGQSDDGTYDGKLTVKLGPMSAAFEGKATVTPEPEARKATIEGKGVDKRGGSRGQVKVVYVITPEDVGSPKEAGSKVSIEADVTLSGPAAQFGRTGLINEMSKRLIVEFASCLEAKLKAGTSEEAAEIKSSEVRGLSLFFASLWASIKKLFKSRD